MDITPKMVQYTNRLPAQERHLIAEIMRQTGRIHSRRDRDKLRESIATTAISYARNSSKRAQDKAQDSQKRTLIGARLKREEVECYKDIAQRTGRSLYAFVKDALRAEAARYDALQEESARCAETQDIEWVPIATTICGYKTREFKG